MLRVGIFTDSFDSIDSYKFTESNSMFKICGIHLQKPEKQRSNYTPFTSPLELMQQIDIALIDLFFDQQVEMVKLAIKKGVHPFIANSQDLSLSTISQFEKLAHEIGVKLGFGQLGYSLVIDSLHVDYPIIAEIKRNTTLVSAQQFDSILKFDIATAINLSKNKIRKIKAYSVPSKSSIPATLFVLIDFDNSSAVTYTLCGSSDTSSFDVEVHHSTKTQHFEIPAPDNIKYERVDFDHFIQDIDNDKDPEQGIDLANSTNFVVETIYSKIM